MIPKIIHRTIQHDTNEVIDACWEKMQELHPGWEFKTWYDEDHYPYVGDYLADCPAGAFRADLIRLDIIYRFGGIYLDSDVLLVKPLDDLLVHDFWNAGEVTRAFGNLAFGAVPHHPAVKDTLYKAIELLPMLDLRHYYFSEKAKEFIAWGPLVHTEALFGRDDVVRLGVDSFTPYTLAQNPKDIVPMFRTLPNRQSYSEHKPLTDETYGVHLMNWSWNPNSSWNNRA